MPPSVVSQVRFGVVLGGDPGWCDGDTLSEPMQRLGAVARVPQLLSAMGQSADAVLADFHIQPGAMHGDLVVPFRLMFELFSRCEAATGREDFGLMLGDMAQMSDFGQVGEVTRIAPTLGRALSTFVSHQMAMSQGFATY